MTGNCLITILMFFQWFSRPPMIFSQSFATPFFVSNGSSSGDSKFELDLNELSTLGITRDEVEDHFRLLVEGKYTCTRTTGHVTTGSNGHVASETPNRHEEKKLIELIKKKKRVGIGGGKFGVRHSRKKLGNPDGFMHRYYLRNRTVTCNDGSRAGYYIHKPHQTSRRWIVFLEGGWFCFDQTSCKSRWTNSAHLMSSDHWPITRKGSGILSSDPTENPFIHDGNLVLIPYCSSDCWSGTMKPTQKGEFAFMGSLILEHVIKDLVHLHGLHSPHQSRLYIAGSSAGGTGVLINLDRIALMLSTMAPSVDVRGISDSGWFLDNKQYKSMQCIDAHQCQPAETARRGLPYWQGVLPEACKFQYPTEHWKCYFGSNLHNTLSTLAFIVQNLFDEAQIVANNVGPPIKAEQWQFIHNIGNDLKRTLANVTAVFAPACISHIHITRSEWYKVSIDGVSLPSALQCWDEGKKESNLHHANPYKVITRMSKKRVQSDAPVMVGDEHKKLKRRKHNSDNIEDKFRVLPAGKLPGNHEEREYDGDSSGMNTTALRTRGRRSAVVGGAIFDRHDVHHIQQHSNRCSHRRIDQCGWPQCNQSCPKVRNPFTGEEIDFIELLVQFGLDLSSVADALGIELTTLQTMDQGKLLRLLVEAGTR